MKSSISYLQHINDETSYLLDATKELSKEDFLKDTTKQRAFVRSLEIIGEAVKKLPDEIKSNYPEIEWKKMAATRDRLIHGYFSIDLDIIWDIISGKISGLHNEIIKVLEDLEDIEAAKARKGEPSIPLEDVKKQLLDD